MRVKSYRSLRTLVEVQGRSHRVRSPHGVDISAPLPVENSSGPKVQFIRSRDISDISRLPQALYGSSWVITSPRQSGADSLRVYSGRPSCR
ncbi:hypothetical protein RvY_07334 [Ramazzottius varieornatus]|uniref:Uncharacterized protein n=1 Tax=Ramazzottius varieornatus TaxID=947166 RepID=A0A1D1VA94_RAMVA|nr:hypothetical protein RvY_07334 [Ramazzottius varieornatus]